MSSFQTHMPAFLVTCMNASLNRPSRPEHLASPASTATRSSKTPQRKANNSQQLLITIQNAVRDDHLGQALELLTNNPLIQLPEHILEELAAKLRVRGLPHQTDLIGNRLQHTALSTLQVLSQSHSPPAVSSKSTPSSSLATTTIPSTSTVTTFNQPSNNTPLHDIMPQTELQILIQQHRLNDAIKYLSNLSFTNTCINTNIVTSNSLELLIKLSLSKGQLKKAQYILDVFFPKFAILPTQLSFLDFINACGRAGSTNRALSVIDGPGFSLLNKEEQSNVYCSLIHACVRCDELIQVDRIIDRMRKQKIKITEQIYIALLNSSPKSFSLDNCLNVLNLMRRDGFQPRTLKIYNAILKSAARAGRINDAFRIYRTILSNDSVSPDLETYNSLLACCNRACDPDCAFKVLDLMLNDDNNVYPNAKSYNFIVAACARVGDVDRSLQVIRRMRHEGIRINIVTYNNLLEACCNAGRLERAFAMVKEIIEKHGVKPNSHTYNALIKGCGKWGMIDAALRLLSSMKSIGVSPTVITYSVAIDACARAGGALAVEHAFNVLNEMENEGIEPNTVTYNSLIHACAQGKNLELAFDVFKNMIRNDIKPDIVTFCTLVDTCGRCGHIEKAFEIIASIPKKFPSLRLNAPIYNALMHACFKANDLGAMENTFFEMKKKLLKPNVVTYSILISAYAANSNMNKAREYLSLMKQNGMKPNRFTYTSLIAAYGRCGNVNLSMTMLNEARKLFGQPDEELYTAAIVAAVRGDQNQLAEQLKDEMSRAGYFVPTVFNRMMRKVGDVEKSGADLRTVLNAMEALKIRPQRAALESLVSAYSKEADVRSALNVLPDMERLGYPPNIQTYKKLIQASALSGKPEDIMQARKLFDMVRSRVTDGDPQLVSHNWIELYGAILRACYKLSDGESKTKIVATLLDQMTTDCGDDNVKVVLSRIGVMEE